MVRIARRLLSVFSVVSVVSVVPCFAAGPGTTAGESLQLGMGPRAAGMGEAFTAQADDASALWWNPAGLARLDAAQATVSTLDLMGDARQHHLGVAFPGGPGRGYGLSLSWLQLEPLEGYDNSGAKLGDVQASDVTLSAGAAHRWQRLAVGASLKYLRSDLGGAVAQTPSLDVGAAWLSERGAGDGRLDLGLSGQNLFGTLKYDKDAFPLPRTVRLGASFSTLLRDDLLTVNADAVQSEAAEGVEFAAGAEYRLLELVALRAGFRTGQDIGSGLRAGLGMRFRSVEFDYGWAGFGDLGSVHRAAVSFRFGPVRDSRALQIHRLFERAAWLRAQGRHLEEVLVLDRILDLDPRNEQALSLMKAAADKVKPGEKR